jgi:integrase/recombinase XerD
MQARTIELEKKAAQAIRNYLAMREESSSDALFLNRFDEPIGERGVRNIVAKYIRQAGLTKSVSPHRLRHIFATEKARRGVSTYTLQKWLGHARLDTTHIYVRLANQSVSRQECIMP